VIKPYYDFVTSVCTAESEISQTGSSTVSERESGSDEHIDRHFPCCLEPGRHVVGGTRGEGTPCLATQLLC
jgi:hypothetical protein